MAAVDPHIVRICCTYAGLICKSRRIHEVVERGHLNHFEKHLAELQVKSLLAAAVMLYGEAPDGAVEPLNAVKDALTKLRKEQSVGTVLLAASVLL